MREITVINLNRVHDFGRPGDVRCDRKTKWGNPFIMYYEKDRDMVCDFYTEYFEEITKPNNIPIVSMILKAGGLTQQQVDTWLRRTGGFLDITDLKDAVRLGCHCKPSRCHCDYLKQKIEELQ